MAEWLSTQDAADRLGLSAETIREKARKKQIPSRKKGSRWEVDVSALDDGGGGDDDEGETPPDVDPEDYLTSEVKSREVDEIRRAENELESDDGLRTLITCVEPEENSGYVATIRGRVPGPDEVRDKYGPGTYQWKVLQPGKKPRVYREKLRPLPRSHDEDDEEREPDHEGRSRRRRPARGRPYGRVFDDEPRRGRGPGRARGRDYEYEDVADPVRGQGLDAITLAMIEKAEAQARAAEERAERREREREEEHRRRLQEEEEKRRGEVAKIRAETDALLAKMQIESEERRRREDREAEERRRRDEREAEERAQREREFLLTMTKLSEKGEQLTRDFLDRSVKMLSEQADGAGKILERQAELIDQKGEVQERMYQQLVEAVSDGAAGGESKGNIERLVSLFTNAAENVMDRRRGAGPGAPGGAPGAPSGPPRIPPLRVPGLADAAPPAARGVSARDGDPAFSPPPGETASAPGRAPATPPVPASNATQQTNATPEDYNVLIETIRPWLTDFLGFSVGHVRKGLEPERMAGTIVDQVIADESGMTESAVTMVMGLDPGQLLAFADAKRLEANFPGGMEVLRSEAGEKYLARLLELLIASTRDDEPQDDTAGAIRVDATETERAPTESETHGTEGDPPGAGVAGVEGGGAR